MPRLVDKPRGVLLALVGGAHVCLVAGMLAAQAGGGNAKQNPHEPGGAVTEAFCTSCHKEAPGAPTPSSTRTILPNPDDFVVDPVAMCLSCHEGEEGSHPLGERPDYAVPADLPLDKDGAISCLTCHYTHGSVKSDHQCASSSILDRFLNRERLYKSYLLRRDNPRGELCKACHQTTAE